MKKVFHIILCCLLLTFSLSVPVLGAEQASMQIQFDKYLDGIDIQLQNTGIIQSVQMDIIIPKTNKNQIKFKWDDSLKDAYKYFVVTETKDTSTVTFYVDSKSSISTKNINLGILTYSGYSNKDEVSSSGNIKLLNGALMEVPVNLPVPFQQASIDVNKEDADKNDGGSSPDGSDDKKEEKPEDKEEETKPKVDQVVIEGSKTPLNLQTSYGKNGTIKITVPVIPVQSGSKKVSVKLNLESENTLKHLQTTQAKNLMVNLVLPENFQKSNTVIDMIKVPKSMLEVIKNENKSVQFTVRDSSDKVLYSIKVDAANMKSVSKDINIALSTYQASKSSLISKLSTGNKNMVISMNEKGSLNGMATVKVNPSLYGIKSGNKLVAYKYNSKTKALDFYKKDIKVSERGYANLSVNKGGTYVLATEGLIQSGSGIKYYKNGSYQTGLVTIKGSQYYFYKSTKNMAVSRTIIIKGITYTIDKDGKAVEK